MKDLMFYMETQQKISEAPDDMKRVGVLSGRGHSIMG